MAQEGFDKLMALTDSRYRLSMIVSRRAAQLKGGIPPLLENEEYPPTRNTVSLAMKEFELNKDLKWGEDMPSTEDLRKLYEREVRREQAQADASYSLSGESAS